MIEKLHVTNVLGESYSYAPDNHKLMNKINEIIDKVNELDIKLHTVKLFTPTQDEAVKELLKLLETDNSIEELLND